MAHIPASREELTLSWVSEILRDVPARLTNISVEPFPPGVGLLSQLSRVRLHYDTNEPGAPESLVVKLPALAAPTVELCAAYGFYARETRFYSNLPPDAPIRVPRAYYAEAAPDGRRFALVLQDFGSAHVGDQVQGATAEQAFRAIHALAPSHARFWNAVDANQADWLTDLGVPQLSHITKQIYGASVDRVLATCPEVFSPLTAGIARRLADYITPFWQRMSSAPRTLTHGDYRLDNLLFPTEAGEGPVVLDWQICGKGRGSFDVGYFISQSLTPALRRSIERDLVRTYCELLKSHGVQGYGFEECWNDVKRTVLYCLVYPIITCGQLDLTSERGRVLATGMLERSLSAILDLEAQRFLDAPEHGEDGG